MPFWMSINLQNSNSPMMEFLLFFHDLTMMLSIMILFNLMFLFFFMMLMKNFSYNFPESQSLEDLWLSIPIVFLMFIGFPSIKNLYMYEEFSECDMTVKVSGFQWYWSYEIMNSNILFESIMKNNNFTFRLIETFNHLILPMKCMIRFMITSNDVIHSWTIPSMGIKVDATPGRISQMISLFQRPGMFLGQCSEICGSNHSFMPILVSVNSLKSYMVSK